ncbi:MAG: type II toxin-antitoxin system VapC family toxin [Solirubrobacterales bacterium]|nr:type II toxin-antitoxin system VapC family toxin [Solirubrobacterales bacterium]
MDGLTTLLDTSVLIGATDVVDTAPEGSWAVSVVTIGELYAGVLLAKRDARQRTRLATLADVLAVAPMIEADRATAVAFGDLRKTSGRASSNDLWIAATALAHDLELVTMDEAQAALSLVRTRLI